MSERFQKIIINELHDYLIKGAGEDYRIEAKQDSHTFYVDKKNIMEQLKSEIYGRFAKVEITDTLRSAIDSIVSEGTESIFNEIKSKFDISKDTASSFEILVNTTYTKLKGGWLAVDPYSNLVTKKVVQSKWDNSLENTMYGQISNSFRNSRRNIRPKLNKLLKQNSQDEISGPFLVVGHLPGSSIAEVRTSKSFSNILSRAANEKIEVTWEQLQQLFGEDTLFLSKLDASELSTWEVSLESALANNPNTKKVFGSEYTESNLYKKYKEILNKAIQKLETNFIFGEGSDSRVTIEKKKIISSFKKGIKKDKKIRVSTVDTKLVLSKGKPISKKIKRKKPSKTKQKTQAQRAKITSVSNKTKTTQPVLNLNALKAQINSRLSMTVIKNMGTPALENRSGRFARSAIVTDVTQTSKGFPSIGYTYQKYPYQTFEPGFKQGSTQRDPRTLIDRSIREIAAQLIVGRFYTRRT